MDDLKKYSPAQINRFIAEFSAMVLNEKNRNTNRFLARGAFLTSIRDALDTRLQTGWNYLTKNTEDADAAQLWFDLLDGYERICQLLRDSEGQVKLIDAAKTIFNGVEVDDDGGISLRVADGSPGTAVISKAGT